MIKLIKQVTLVVSVTSLLLLSCVKTPDAIEITGSAPVPSFTMELDDNVPGKVNLVNTSVGASNQYWELWLLTSSGTRYISSTYDRSTSSDPSTYFFIHENSEIEVVLQVTSSAGIEAETSQKINITNVPTKMTVQKIVIIYVDLVDEYGYEWDDADIFPNDNSYDFPEEYPDLLVNNDVARQGKGYEEDGVVWDVNIETGLPVELVVEQTVYETLSPQTWEYYIELLDYDGAKGSPGFQGAHQIGVKRINPYHLTHKYNDGEDSNFPNVYKIEEDKFKADLYLKWE